VIVRPDERTKQRRSLTHVGGEVQTFGERSLARALAHALDVSPAAPAGSAPLAEEAVRGHVHGFHTYPARMHPTTAERLVRLVCPEGGSVLDPFCGSGTVLVEAMIAGRQAIGTDLNPLAVQLARLKTGQWDPAAREALVTGARQVDAFASARRKRKAGATRRYPPEDVALFEPHVLLEADSVRAGIRELIADPRLREALMLVLSAILMKVSRRASDTSPAVGPRRLAAGYATRLFVRKSEELARRLQELATRLPAGVIAARVSLDDALRLRSVAASTVHAVVTSPPYVATYDYAAHHSVRMRWLELDASAFLASEVGARRRYARMDAGAARQTWTRELTEALRAMRRVCRPEARIALLLADSAVQEEALRADAIVHVAARDAGFIELARALQRRPHFHAPTAWAFRDEPRAEHAFLLRKM
jgi:DNA modification methylase